MAASLAPAGVSRTPAYGSYSTSPDSASALTIVVAVPGATPTAVASCPIGTRRRSSLAVSAWYSAFR